MGADETQIEALFGAALRIATAQKSISLPTRAEATYAEYRRQKAIVSAGFGYSFGDTVQLPARVAKWSMSTCRTCLLHFSLGEPNSRSHASNALHCIAGGANFRML
jgi:hypothetical protein